MASLGSLLYQLDTSWGPSMSHPFDLVWPHASNWLFFDPQHNWIHLTCSTCEALCLIDISITVEKGVCGRIPSPYCKCEFHFQKPWVPVHPGSIVDLLHFCCSHCQGMGSHCPPPLHLIWSKLMSFLASKESFERQSGTTSRASTTGIEEHVEVRCRCR